MVEVSRKNDMWPDLELHMDKDSNSYKIWITGKENDPCFPFVWRDVQFCTLRWGGHSLETRKALFDLFNILEPDSKLASCFRRLSSEDQVLQLCLEEDDNDMIVEFPLGLWKKEREITLQYGNLSWVVNKALNNLYEAMISDSKKGI